MPPLPRLRIAAIDELDRQLRFSSPETARKQLERVEALCGEIEPERTYPEEWVVFRITGYRIETPGAGHAAPALIVGRALVGDLTALVERLSVTAGVTESELLGPGPTEPPAPGQGRSQRPRDAAWISAAELCRRWSISRKSLDRYRKQGLAGRRAATTTARSKLYFRIDSVERFEQRHAAPLAAAGAFSRIDAALEAKLLRMARRYRERLGWSLNQTALRLADRYGRGHETVRSLLKRHDADSTRASVGAKRSQPGTHRPVFSEAGPLTQKQQRVIERAFAFGVEVEQLARRFNKTRPTIYRSLAMARAARLRGLSLPAPSPAESPSRVQPVALTRGPLAEPGVLSGLGAPAPRTLGELVGHALQNPTPEAIPERARAGAIPVLLAQAATAIAALSPHHPTPGTLDEIETLLRWASRLKAELVRSQLSLLLKTIAGQLGQDLVSLPRSVSIGLLDDCLVALGEAVDRFDPHKGGRLAAPCGLALSRVVSHWQRRLSQPAPGASKALAYTNPDQVELRDWTLTVSPWQAWLEPPAGLRERLPQAPSLAQELLALRHGWLGGPPITIAAAGARLGMTAHHAAALARRTSIDLRRAR